MFVVSKEGGRQEIESNDAGPVYSAVPLVSPAREQAQVVHVPNAAVPNSVGPDDDSVVHMMNWIEAMRDRKQPNATVDHGFSHSMVCIMASQAYWSGKKQYWHAATETIQDHPPET